MDRIADLIYALARAWDWLVPRAKVVAKAAPTWLAVVVLAAPQVADALAPVLPAPWAEHLTALALKVVAICSAVIVAIRRLSPVLDKAKRGLIEVDGA